MSVRLEFMTSPPPRIPFADLAVTLTMRAAMGEALRRRRQGLLLVTSPPRHGRSTTLTALVFDFNPYPDRAAMSSGGALPRFSIVENADDPAKVQTIQDRLECGESVFATMIASSVFEALDLLLRRGFSRQELARHLRGCLNQRLVARPCPECRTLVFGSAPMVDRFSSLVQSLDLGDGALGDPWFMYCRGCPHCQGTGESGRTGLFEWLDPVCLEDVSSLDPDSSLESHLAGRAQTLAQTHGMGAFISLREDARAKVLDQSIAIHAASGLSVDGL